jgi:hypothetical protein
VLVQLTNWLLGLMSLIGQLKSLKEESGSMLSARLLWQLSFTVFGLIKMLRFVVEKSGLMLKVPKLLCRKSDISCLCVKCKHYSK